MRIYNDPVEMVKEVERDLFEMGLRVDCHTVQDKNVEGDSDYQNLELFGYTYRLTSFTSQKLSEMIAYMKGNEEWAKHELVDRLSPEYINPGKAYKKWEKVWKPFLRDGTFSYTYNQRIRDQLPCVIQELKKRPNSRQAIITVYDKHLDMNNWGGLDRVCCSLYYQLFYRSGKLNMIYSMRSCDFLTHFVHDVYFAIGILRYVAKELDWDVGFFIHFLGSLHAFRKDMEGRGIF